MRKTKKPNKIKSIVEEAATTYEDILRNNKNMKENKNCNELVKRIVESIEVKKKIDILAYRELIRTYPQTKNTVDSLISELKTFSVYDDEPLTVNFDYSAYLEQIEELSKIQ